MNKWYTMTKPDALQGLICEEGTGANIAVSYDPKHAHMIAAALDMFEALKLLRDECQSSRKYIVLDDDNGFAAYNATAVAIQADYAALRKATEDGTYDPH